MTENSTSGRYGRRKGEEEQSWRSPPLRDIDRVLYSGEWSRLEGVSQVSPVSHLSRSHNRLTHSLKVAQVSQRCAQRMLAGRPELQSELDPDVAFLAGLAHDLGHPPFGHVAEKALQERLTEEYEVADENGDLNSHPQPWSLPDSFEGNAQTFRIVARTAVKKLADDGSPDGLGLNLTHASLSACTKYPWCIGEASDRVNRGASHEKYFSGKWGAYESEREALVKALDDGNVSRERALEAEIMDYADDVTYAIHDVEDYFRAGLIPLHEIMTGLVGRSSQGGSHTEECERFIEYADSSITLKSHIPYDGSAARSWLVRSMRAWPDRAYSDRADDRSKLLTFASTLVDAATARLSVTAEGLKPSDDVISALEFLKELTWYYVINHPSLAASQQGQKRIIKNLHEWLYVWMCNALEVDSTERDPYAHRKRRRNQEALPHRLVDLFSLSQGEVEITHYTEKQQISRAVTDYISGLTDNQARDLHAHLGGTVPEVDPVTWLG